MKPKQIVTIWRFVDKKRGRIVTACLLSMCILLCGFTWDWAAHFTGPTLFPLEDAVDSKFILDFGSVVNVDELQAYLTEPLIAEQLVNEIGANLSVRVYDSIKLPDMAEESLGNKIIRIIFDRLFH